MKCILECQKQLNMDEKYAEGHGMSMTFFDDTVSRRWIYRSMKMKIGWIDFSKKDREKVLDVINALDIQGAVDELGIGAIRDRFADYFFPGTSTVQTRAKYFLIVPYILKEAGEGRFGNEVNTIMRYIDEEERKCRDRLILKNKDGVIGSLNPNSWVLKTPSSIYWSGIKKLGIFTVPELSISEYIRECVLKNQLKEKRKYGNRNKDSEENEKDDIDAGDITSYQFWRLDKTYRSDWRNDLSIDLTFEEATYLNSQIQASNRDTLFAYLLRNDIDINKYEDFEEMAIDLADKVDENTKMMLNLANDFNKLLLVITTRYNHIISQNTDEEISDMCNKVTNNIDDGVYVDINKIFVRLGIRDIYLKSFLLSVQQAVCNGEFDKVDEIIMTREKNLKKESRAKTLNRIDYVGRGWIGTRVYDYRLRPAKRIINDIKNGETRQNV